MLFPHYLSIPTIGFIQAKVSIANLKVHEKVFSLTGKTPMFLGGTTGLRLICVLLACVLSGKANAQTGLTGPAIEGTDEGILISGDHIPIAEAGITLMTDGGDLIPEWRRGHIESSNPASPLYQAAYLQIGTSVRGADDAPTNEVAILEFVDGDGDVTWAVVAKYYPGEYPAHFHFIGGTGKWHGITGEGIFTEYAGKRGDGRNMVDWKIQWKVQTENIGHGGYNEKSHWQGLSEKARLKD